MTGMGDAENGGKDSPRRYKHPVRVALGVLAAFVLAFIGLTAGLNALADQMQLDSVSIAEVSVDSPSYVLLVGSDSRRGTALYNGNPREHGQTAEHADVVTLMRIDPRNYTLTLVTVPADTVVTGDDRRIGSYLEEDDAWGVVHAVERLTGAKIDYYARVSFSGFEGIVNALGGVRTDVPVSITMNDPSTAGVVEVSAGPAQHLNGSQTLALVRETEAYGAYGDAQRQQVVRTVEESLIRSMFAMRSELNVEEVLRVVENDVDTNIDLPVAGSLIMDFVRHSAQVKVYSCTGPYAASRDAEGTWTVADDPAAWRELMLAVSSGEDPSAVVEQPEGL